jgi:hypothetical protein
MQEGNLDHGHVLAQFLKPRCFSMSGKDPGDLFVETLKEIRIRPMKRTIVAAAFTLLIATPALAQSVGEKTGVNSALGIAPKTEDFIKEAATSDMLEIEAAKIAGQKRQRQRKEVC